MNAKHPWDDKIDDFAVVTRNGLRVSHFGSESEARAFALRCPRLAVAYGPGLRNRLVCVLDGEAMTPAEFDRRRAGLAAEGA